MNSRILPNVFDRFYRGDPARNRDKDSTGLELAIVKAIIEEHAGTVTVNSSGVGQGSVFVIVLPLG